MLLGFDQQGQNVYSALVSRAKYEDGKHPWDKPGRMLGMSMRSLRGFIFNEAGELEQEFESNFNLKTGLFEQGWSRNEEGFIDEY